MINKIGNIINDFRYKIIIFDNNMKVTKVGV